MSFGVCAQKCRQRLLWRRLTPPSSMCLLPRFCAFFSRCQLRLCANVAGTAATAGQSAGYATPAEGKTVSFTAPTGITSWRQYVTWEDLTLRPHVMELVPAAPASDTPRGGL
ncbi:hypothetical protein TcBrA4_0042140 [Trypanosoma cruzi]|nr:hypothetical protein TcBrA4_0042140 [Trypanosoma cruzi]